MSPESVQNLLALALGFAVAGLCSSAGFWSLMSGLALVMALQACGLLLA